MRLSTSAGANVPVLLLVLLISSTLAQQNFLQNFRILDHLKLKHGRIEPRHPQGGYDEPTGYDYGPPPYYPPPTEPAEPSSTGNRS